MPKGIKCVKCGHSSVVRSNFKGLSDGRFYCNSSKRPACLVEWQVEHDYNHSKNWNNKPLIFNPIGWK